MPEANKQVKPLVCNQQCVLLTSPEQFAEKIGIRSLRLVDLERGGRAVALPLWQTAGITALCPQAASLPTALCPKVVVSVPACWVPPACSRPMAEEVAVLKCMLSERGHLAAGSCSFSQLISLLLAADAGAPLAVHEGSTAEGPDGVEHCVCHGFTGCQEARDHGGR